MYEKIKYTYKLFINQIRLDTQFIYGVVISSVEKDPHDTTQKAKESQDTSHKILELQKKLDSARSQVRIKFLCIRIYLYMQVYLTQSEFFV